jgi:PRC-barrel domain
VLVDRDGEKIGKLRDVYVDVETDESRFATVKEGFIGRHLTSMPLGGIKVVPGRPARSVSKQQVQDAPILSRTARSLSQTDESAPYHFYQLNYAPRDIKAAGDSPARSARRPP